MNKLLAVIALIICLVVAVVLVTNIVAGFTEEVPAHKPVKSETGNAVAFLVVLVALSIAFFGYLSYLDCFGPKPKEEEDDDIWINLGWNRIERRTKK